MPEVGDHLVVNKTCYTHHGLYVGDFVVVHYSGFSDGFRSGPIESISLESFCDNGKYEIWNHKNRKYSRDESVERAFSRIGEEAYSLVFNNCEHFVNWCIEGKHRSDQVRDTAMSITRVTIEAYKAYKDLNGPVICSGNLGSIGMHAAKVAGVSATVAGGATLASGGVAASTAAAVGVGGAATAAVGVGGAALATAAAPAVAAAAVGYGLCKAVSWFFD